MPDPAKSPVADADDEKAPTPIRPFPAFLAEQRGGGLSNEASETLAEVATKLAKTFSRVYRGHPA